MSEDRVDREIGWDDEISGEVSEFTLLPEGDYDFEVIGFKRSRHEGSAKLPPCGKAMLTLRIYDTVNNDTTVIQHNIFMHTKTQGMIAAFLIAIGQQKQGETCRPNWTQDAMIGATGRAKVYIDEWEGNDGKTKQSNKIKKFYPKDDGGETPPADVQAAFNAGDF